MIEKNHTTECYFYFCFCRELRRACEKRGLIPPQGIEESDVSDDDDVLPDLVNNDPTILSHYSGNKYFFFICMGVVSRRLIEKKTFNSSPQAANRFCGRAEKVETAHFISLFLPYLVFTLQGGIGLSIFYDMIIVSM